MKKAAFLALLALLPIVATFAKGREESSPTNLQQELIELGFQVFKTPAEAPDFELINLDGETVSLSSFRGKVVLLNFWATWCPPCRAEMPSMQTLFEDLNDEGFEIVAVDLREPIGTVRSYIEENGYTYTVLLDSTGSVGGTYGARSIPTSYIIDRDGFALGYLIGSRSWEGDEVRNTLLKLLES